MDLILRPIRLASSKPAQKAYLNTVLFLAGSAVLWGLAASAYTLFYMSYIPKIGIERVVHLQYGDGPNPYALVSLDSSIMPQQAYDVAVEIDLPRSLHNIQIGNFMVDMIMLSPTYKHVGRATSTDPFNLRSWIPTETILFSSRRPAILTYSSDVVSFGKQVAGLPWYLLGWRRENEKLEVPMAEGVTFKKGWKNIPNRVYLDIQSRGQDVQVYDMRLILRARFSGLRWLMYNHRIISFVIFTTAFWVAEVIFALVAWLLLQSTLDSGEDGGAVIKSEDPSGSSKIKTEMQDDDVMDTDDLDLSDTPRSFPTYGRESPLPYVPKVKSEDDSEELVSDEIRTHPRAAEADDESEELIDVGSTFAGARSGSGLGTSFSESAIRTAAQRRRSRGENGPNQWI